jgi:hypothetical protein
MNGKGREGGNMVRGSGQNTFKVPRQCPFVGLVAVRLREGIELKEMKRGNVLGS